MLITKIQMSRKIFMMKKILGCLGFGKCFCSAGRIFYQSKSLLLYFYQPKSLLLYFYQPEKSVIALKRESFVKRLPYEGFQNLT